MYHSLFAYSVYYLWPPLHKVKCTQHTQLTFLCQYYWFVYCRIKKEFQMLEKTNYLVCNWAIALNNILWRDWWTQYLLIIILLTGHGIYIDSVVGSLTGAQINATLVNISKYTMGMDVTDSSTLFVCKYCLVDKYGLKVKCLLKICGIASQVVVYW